MHAGQVMAATPSPAPKVPNADQVTPGVWGFAIIFAIGIVTILLIWDMMRRVRRTRYRAEVNAKLDAEQSQAGDSGAVVPRDPRRGTQQDAPQQPPHDRDS
ncbi:hypothetical protein FPZ11_06265 [Humibacter ginsenosidimutans]|uniref:Uncharacterized protein n=1 Tax=Humibacter ginsenosidimutans TaxID=2599293 RepID=A0A5B8M7Q1_9MICO|nr:hypothetical protein FPZ11_06265 [Humibacter ginsenosidimutans]